MVVTSVARPKLLNFISGITAILVAVGFTLYLYVYMSEFAGNNSSLTMEPTEIPRLFLFFCIVLGLGIWGGFEIGTFAQAQNKKSVHAR
jgi:hypothetical protein